MKSDVAEFMQKAKPSLIQLLTKQAEYQPEKQAGEEKRVPAAVVATVFAGVVVLGIAGWFGYRYLSPMPEALPPAEEVIPPSPMSAEKSQTFTVARDAAKLRRTVVDAAEVNERTGSLKRLIIKIQEADGKTKLLTPKDFFTILDIHPPSQLPDSLGDSLFLYIYYASDGPRAAFIAPSRNAGRTFAGMLGWESSMQRDLEVLFLGQNIKPVIAPFLDKTFKNVDYRFLEVAPGVGFGHFAFSAKNFLVLTTSEEALHVVINRLFEAR